MATPTTPTKLPPSWENALKPRMPYIESILQKVQTMRDHGKEIYPAQNQIFHALDFADPDDIKVCIIGQDPYHEPDQAQGLAFSVAPGTKIPPSLRNIHKELVEDIGCARPTTGDLTPWAQQGVLLLNTVLTTERGTANAHAKLGWQIVTASIIDVLLDREQPPVFILWGKAAVSFMNRATQQYQHDKEWPAKAHRIVKIRSSHPCPMSVTRKLRVEERSFPPFAQSHPFSRANAIIKQRGQTPIRWDLP